MWADRRTGKKLSKKIFVANHNVPFNTFLSINFHEINEKNADIVSHIFIAINKIVKELNIADSGYRIINNCGVDAVP